MGRLLPSGNYTFSPNRAATASSSATPHPSNSQQATLREAVGGR
jgi:hypothetical protein